MERKITNISEGVYNKTNDFLMMGILMSLQSKDDL